jgi:hypothetical protein
MPMPSSPTVFRASVNAGFLWKLCLAALVAALSLPSHAQDNQLPDAPTSTANPAAADKQHPSSVDGDSLRPGGPTDMTNSPGSSFPDLFRPGSGFATNPVGGRGGPRGAFNLNRSTGSLLKLGNDLSGNLGGEAGAGLGTAFHFLSEANEIERRGLSIPLDSSLFSSQSSLQSFLPGNTVGHPNALGGSPDAGNGQLRWSANMNLGSMSRYMGGGTNGMGSLFSSPGVNGNPWSGMNMGGGQMGAGMSPDNSMGLGSGGAGRGHGGTPGPSVSLHLNF